MEALENMVCVRNLLAIFRKCCAETTSGIVQVSIFFMDFEICRHTLTDSTLYLVHPESFATVLSMVGLFGVQLWSHA
jgi:hypothetical protein